MRRGLRRRRAAVARARRGHRACRRSRGVFGDAPFVGTILLTHLHWDHVQGLPFFPPADRDDAMRDVRAARARRSGRSAGSAAMSPPHFPIGPDGAARRVDARRARAGPAHGRRVQGARARGRAQGRPHVRLPRRLGRPHRRVSSRPPPDAYGPGPDGLGEYHEPRSSSRATSTCSCTARRSWRPSSNAPTCSATPPSSTPSASPAPRVRVGSCSPTTAPSAPTTSRRDRARLGVEAAVRRLGHRPVAARPQTPDEVRSASDCELTTRCAQRVRESCRERVVRARRIACGGDVRSASIRRR